MSVTGGAQLQISANLTTSERITIADAGTVVNMNAGVFSVVTIIRNGGLERQPITVPPKILRKQGPGN